MSTGADCRFIEEKPGEWYYEIQEWPYGDWPEYDINGPFNSQEDALQHLDDNYANPGGWWTVKHNDPHYCGKKPSEKIAEREAQRKVMWEDLKRQGREVF